MVLGPQPLLVLAAVAVGVFHTMVPDHWAPLALIARQRGWSLARTARAAALAGVGHTVSTLAIAVVVWIAGVAAAARLGNVVELVVSAALISFGTLTAVAALREVSTQSGHAHVHRHEDGLEHVHWHLAPLPVGTPFDSQQFEAISRASYLRIPESKQFALAEMIRGALGSP